jgi:hypothetical protein
VLLVCGLYAGVFAFTVYSVARYYGVEKAAPGWALRTDGTGWFVSEVDAGGPAAGRMQLGDRLLAINGDQRRAVFGTYAWSFEEGGKAYRIHRQGKGVNRRSAKIGGLPPGLRPSLIQFRPSKGIRV